MSNFESSILANSRGSLKFSKRDRHWRLILSVALLLPALVALIGIVAWSISSEVADGGAWASQRKLAQHQNYKQQQLSAYQLLRLQSSPAVAASRTAPVAAAILAPEVSHKDATQTPTPKSISSSNSKPQDSKVIDDSNHKGSKSTENLAARNKPSEQTSGETQIETHSHNEATHKRRESQTANEGKDEGETNVSSAKRIDPSKSPRDENGGTREDEREIEEEARRTVNVNGNGKQKDVDEEEEDSELANAKAVLRRRRKKEEKGGSKDESSRYLILDNQENRGNENNSANNNNNNRGYSNDETKNRYSNRHFQASSKASQSSWQQARKAKSFSIDSNAEAQSDDEILDGTSEQQQEEEEPRGEQVDPKEAKKRDERREIESHSVLDTKDSNAADAKSNSRKRNSLKQANKRDKQQVQQPSLKPEIADEDDSASFEAIASAISTTLAASDKTRLHKESRATLKAHKKVASSALEGDTGDLPQDSMKSSADEARDRSRQDEEKKRSTGEQVAQLIDQIVERRNLRGQPESVRLQREQVSRGPQIVVVSPMSDANMKARSLVKLEEKPELKSENQTKPVQPKPLGARLLGSGEPAGESKYSERVEVIEDDDSSALLIPIVAATPSGGELAVDSSFELPDSIHVSSQPDKPKSRSQRHDLRPGQILERYSISSSANISNPPRAERRSSESESALDSQEQAKGETVSKAAASSGQKSEQKLYSAERLILDHLIRSKAKAAKQQPATSKIPAERNATKLDIQAPEVSTTPPQPPPAAKEVKGQPRQQTHRQAQLRNELQAVKVPMIIEQPFIRRPQMVVEKPVEAYEMAESQYQSNTDEFVQQAQYHQQQRHQVQPSHQQLYPSASQTQPKSQLPILPDQEFNVPAHLADSVIQNIQRTPSAVRYVNGQLTLMPNGPDGLQVPPQPHPPLQISASMQHPQSTLYMPFYGRHATQEAQMRDSGLAVSASSQANSVMRAPSLFDRILQVRGQIHNHNTQANQQNPLNYENKMLVNRESLDGSVEQVKSSPSKAFIPPMAQMALRHLMSSMSQPQVGAAPSAVPNVVDARSSDGVSMFSSSSSSSSSNSNNKQASQSSSELQESQQILSAKSASDGAQPGSQVSQQQPQIQFGDQDVQESYNQMPVYHMHEPPPPPPPPVHYGGEGIPAPPYGHQPDHDKRTKGVTFHFGGGPIGGGTQLITSPMGIFKHLMLPLLPNPRVNLNGKVVFGVVLEKSTAFGSPPKKKRFWG